MPSTTSGPPDVLRIADRLVSQFDHMVRRDGGSLTVTGADDASIRLAYHPGIDPSCEDGACVLPGAELRTLMSERLHRTHPAVDLIVDVV
jgi:hypothetical protein